MATFPAFPSVHCLVSYVGIHYSNVPTIPVFPSVLCISLCRSNSWIGDLFALRTQSPPSRTHIPFVSQCTLHGLLHGSNYYNVPTFPVWAQFPMCMTFCSKITVPTTMYLFPAFSSICSYHSDVYTLLAFPMWVQFHA